MYTHYLVAYRNQGFKIHITFKCIPSGGGLQAAFAEADLRLSELKKRTYEFDREVVKGGVDTVSLRHNYFDTIYSPTQHTHSHTQRTGIIVAEKVARYFEDQLKSMVRERACIMTGSPSCPLYLAPTGVTG